MPGFEEAGGLEGDPDLDFIQDPKGDPELAAEYFREAGYESGKYEGDEEILIVAENAGIDKRVGQAVIDLFEELGFNVTYREVTGDIMYTKFCNRPAAEVAACPNVGWLKDFNDGAGDARPDVQRRGDRSDEQLELAAAGRCRRSTRRCNKAKLVTDPAERAQAWGEIDSMIMAQAPAIPYVWDDQANVYSAT